MFSNSCILYDMTEPTATETADTRRDIDWTTVAGVTFFVTVSLLAGAASLLMSFHGLRDLVIRVEGVQGWLSNVGPIGIDGLQLASFAVLMFTVGAPFRVRLYLWCAFFGAIGLSVLGNALDAWARHTGAFGIGMSAVWPALLAAATHLAVIAIRWWKTSGLKETAVATVEAEPAKATEAKAKAPTEAQLASWAKARYRTTPSSAKVAAAMRDQGWDVSDKKVERWTRDLRTPVPTPIPVESAA